MGRSMCGSAKIAAWALATLLAGVVFAASATWNSLGLAKSEAEFAHYQLDSDGFVLGKTAVMLSDFQKGLLQAPCLPRGAYKAASEAARTAFPDPVTSCAGEIYTGNPGAQSLLLASEANVFQTLGLRQQHWVDGLRLSGAFGFMASLFALSWFIAARFSLPAAVGFLLPFLLGEPWAYLGASLYWLPLFWVLPPLWIAAGHAATLPRRLMLPGLALLVFLRSLMGLELVTASTGCALLAWAIFDPAIDWRHRTIRSNIRFLVAPAAAIAAGVVLGILVTLSWLTLWTGSLDTAWSIFSDRVLYRSIDVGQNLTENHASQLSKPLSVLLLILALHPVTLFSLPPVFWLALSATGILLLSRDDPRSRRLALCLLGVAITISLSWPIIAKGHAYGHLLIVNALAFMPAIPVAMATLLHQIALRRSSCLDGQAAAEEFTPGKTEEEYPADARG